MIKCKKPIMKKRLLVFLSIVSLGIMGCSITSDNTEIADYATQNRVSAIEYSIFINKQVTIFTTQLTSHISLISNRAEDYENMILVAEESIAIMNDTLNEVHVTYPPVTYDDDRETVLSIMEITMDHMKNYLHDMKNKKDISKYIDVFQSDHALLISQANLYYR